MKPSPPYICGLCPLAYWPTWHPFQQACVQHDLEFDKKKLGMQAKSLKQVNEELFARMRQVIADCPRYSDYEGGLESTFPGYWQRTTLPRLPLNDWRFRWHMDSFESTDDGLYKLKLKEAHIVEEFFGLEKLERDYKLARWVVPPVGALAWYRHDVFRWFKWT